MRILKYTLYGMLGAAVMPFVLGGIFKLGHELCKLTAEILNIPVEVAVIYCVLIALGGVVGLSIAVESG